MGHFFLLIGRMNLSTNNSLAGGNKYIALILLGGLLGELLGGFLDRLLGRLLGGLLDGLLNYLLAIS